jgi:hypothetical protein
MFVARWQIDARFGHKQTVIDRLRKWERGIGATAGTDEMDFKILTGSIGAREATVEANHAIESMARLDRFCSDRQQRRPPAMGQGSGALCGVGLRALERLSVGVRIPERLERCPTAP